MNPKKLMKLTAGLLVCCGWAGPAFAQVTISVDMDTGTPGIQTNRSTLGPFTAGLVMTVGPGGVSSYGISFLFDTTELALVGSPASSVPALPGGLSPLGSVIESSPYVYTFNGATFGPGPASTTFTFGTISFTATALVDDGIADITPGFFNVGIDGLFDSAGFAVVPVFNPGFVVPEPNAAALFLCGTAAFWLLQRSRRG